MSHTERRDDRRAQRRALESESAYGRMVAMREAQDRDGIRTCHVDTTDRIAREG